MTACARSLAPSLDRMFFICALLEVPAATYVDLTFGEDIVSNVLCKFLRDFGRDAAPALMHGPNGINQFDPIALITKALRSTTFEGRAAFLEWSKIITDKDDCQLLSRDEGARIATLTTCSVVNRKG